MIALLLWNMHLRRVIATRAQPYLAVTVAGYTFNNQRIHITCSLAFGELGPNPEAGGNNEELFELWHTSRCGLSCGF